ncbi:hypothetical protein GCM10009841_27740 [Microlunatus panaciterrae]|uniref:DUF4328 domain-containing protein n=1 Tax=Microlunatus panaciterrae TaxID=400768 RepID=A0ABS2RIE4_9ACTN|nr:hypothetical protein [Microlunatus panaciterrae]MBM7798342.1 hypothetical protein [Microlunatus panaciterrae]
MRDEQYRPDDIGAYGAREQPAIVARMTPHLRLTQVGNLLALVAVILTVAAQLTYPQSFASVTGRAAMVTALVSSVLLLLICSFQHFAWLRAMAEWKGQRDVDLVPLRRISWILHLVSYLVLIVGLWGCVAASGAAGWSATASVLLAFALLSMIAAQICAGVQYLRTSGPPGTVPTHMRALLRRANPRAPRPGDED